MSIAENFIYKNINKNSVVLEIGAGQGRWSEFILKKAERVILVDVSEKCINFCRKMFSKSNNVEYYVNDGKRLDFIKENSVDFVWSFDSFVHMERDVIDAYFREFSRILKKGGKAIIHHHGGRRSLSDTLPLLGMRSNVSKQTIKELAKKHKLAVKYQTQSWGKNSEFNCKLRDDYISEIVKK